MQHDLTETTLQKNLAGYLTGKTTLNQFYDWFVLAAWDIDLTASARLRETVHEIEYLLDEFSYGSRSEAVLQEKLRPFVIPVEINLSPTLPNSTQQAKPAAS